MPIALTKRQFLFYTGLILLPVLWLVIASAIWSNGTGRSFALLGWWDATKWWSANLWCKIWLSIGAATPTLLALLLFTPFLMRGRRGPIERRLMVPSRAPLRALQGAGGG